MAAASADAAGKTEKLKVFSKQLASPSPRPTAPSCRARRRPRPQPGDSFEIDSLDYRGTHKKHSKKPIGADYLQCTFGSGPEPDCHGYTALGNSLLRFHGFDLIGAIGKFKDAKVLSNKEVPGGSDFVIRLTRR